MTAIAADQLVALFASPTLTDIDRRRMAERVARLLPSSSKPTPGERELIARTLARVAWREVDAA